MVAERGEFGHDVVPGGSVEPQASDEQDVHGGSPEEESDLVAGTLSGGSDIGLWSGCDL
jgi:hypothetical protein